MYAVSGENIFIIVIICSWGMMTIIVRDLIVLGGALLRPAFIDSLCLQYGNEFFVSVAPGE